MNGTFLKIVLTSGALVVIKLLLLPVLFFFAILLFGNPLIVKIDTSLTFLPNFKPVHIVHFTCPD